MRFQHGFSLVEAMFALAFLVALIASAGALQLRQAESAQQLQAAEHLKLVADAAGKYVKDNYASIVLIAGPSAPTTITVPMLINTGYLPNGFELLNAYAQDYEVRVIQPKPNTLEALVVSLNGTLISELGIRRIAKLVGAKGGFISSLDEGRIKGGFGGWEIPLSTFGISRNAGHIGAAVFFEDAAVVNDYLHRRAVPGKAELNAMNTSLDMQGNNISGVGILNSNNIQANKIQVHEARAGQLELSSQLELNYVDSIGGKCSKAGLFSRTATGELLSCVGGQWRQEGIIERTYTFTNLPEQKGGNFRELIPGGSNNKLCMMTNIHVNYGSSVSLTTVKCEIDYDDGLFYMSHGNKGGGRFGRYGFYVCEVTCI